MNCPFELRKYNYQFLNLAVKIFSIFSKGGGGGGAIERANIT